MKLKIFGELFKLKRSETIETHGVYGYCDPNKLEIVIDQSLDGTLFLETLIHEIGHAVFYRTGIRQTKMPLEVEEIICENISKALIENLDIKIKARKR